PEASPSDVSKTQDVPSIALQFVRKLFHFPQVWGVRMFYVPIVIPFISSLVVVCAPEAYLSPAP
ncbi:MAG: hypothetical protein M3H12_01430, partial [Chromatiales bacterium]